MEVSDLVNRTKRCSSQDIRLELPPNQQSQNPTANTIIVIKLDSNIFLFRFQHETDAQKTFLKRPWSIRGGHLILKKWNPCLTWKEVDFSKSTLWIQVHGLPTLWLSEANLKIIGTLAGDVIELDLSGEGGSEWRRFTRIKVNIEVEQPLLPGVFLPRPNLDDLWVSLKYEKLSIICYICGLIGHDEKDCNREIYKLQNPFGARFKAAGPWLRPENDHIPMGVYDKLDLQKVHATWTEIEEEPLVPDTAVQPSVECSQDLPQVYPLQGQMAVGLCSHANCTSSSSQIPAELGVTIVATQGLSHPLSPNPCLSNIQPTPDTHVGPVLPQAHSPPQYQTLNLSPDIHAPTPVSELGPILPQAHSPSQPNHTSHSSPSSRPSPHSSSPTKTNNQTQTFTLSPPSTFHMVNTQSIPSDTPHTSTPVSKRKISKEELSTFTKRLKIASNASEPVFFDPVTTTLIPKSKIESFILEEEHKSHSPFIPKVHGEPLKGKARTPNLSKSVVPLTSVEVAHTLSVHTAEEAGLTMPPPLP
nr:hypothetical protein CFP56_61541 [Quercus suber]